MGLEPGTSRRAGHTGSCPSSALRRPHRSPGRGVRLALYPAGNGILQPILAGVGLGHSCAAEAVAYDDDLALVGGHQQPLRDHLRCALSAAGREAEGQDNWGVLEEHWRSTGRELEVFS